jgi:antirestriction protein
MTTPRIYVVCLSAFTNGLLHGKWIDIDGDRDEIMTNINAMLSTSPMAKIQACQEWAIHAYEGFESIAISEYESIDKVLTIALKLKEHGKAFAAYLEYWNLEDIEKFEDSYRGCYKNEEEFVEEYYRDAGLTDQIEAAGLKADYIDFETIARDMFINSYTGISKGTETLYVFSQF